LDHIALIESAISRNRSHATRLLIALAAVIAATLLRAALSSLGTHLTFVTYYPAILICSVLAGWRYGWVSAILSGAVAETYFDQPFGRFVANGPTVTNLLLFVGSSAIIIVTGDMLRRSVRDLEQANRVARILNAELQHRVRNMLTVVQALAANSAKGTSPETFVATLGGRLQALAKAHELLGRRSLHTCTLPELIDEACQPFCEGENIVKSGPVCELPSASCVPLVLALHELCTNALKYGALSKPQGKVEISWCFTERPARTTIEWREIGGPVVAKPTRKGLGSALLRAQPGLADVTLKFERSGLYCKISIDGAMRAAQSSSAIALPPEQVALASG
jgi:two-component sensor histidine kinase